MNRQRVTVVGAWEQMIPHAEARFRVHSIRFAASPDEPFSFDSSLQTDGTSALSSSRFAPASGSLRWVMILCRFADAPDVTPHPVSWYEELMGSSHPALGHYWKEVSYETITDLADSAVVGWYNLPRPKSYYASSRSSPRVEEGRYDFVKAAEDCTAAADADVFFPDFDGFGVVFNQDFDPPGDNLARGGSDFMTLDGARRFWCYMDDSRISTSSACLGTRDGSWIGLASFLLSL